MNERSYRFILGITIIVSLFLELQWAIYLIIAMISIEFFSNRTLPFFINRLFNTSTSPPLKKINIHYSNINAERIYRLVIVIFLSLGTTILQDMLWFFPWVVGLNLTIAGITGICPLVIALQKIGLK